MKTKLQLAFLFFGVALVLPAQVKFAKIGNNPGNINTTAVLEVESTTKGFLPPRMTQNQMISLANPAEGLVVYCTDCTPKGVYHYNGLYWAQVGGSVVSTPTVTPNCATNGFTGAYINGIALSGASFSTTITNNSLSQVPLTFAAGDLSLSGVTGFSVGTPSPASATIDPGASQTITYPITGTPTSTGTLTGTWNKSSLNCSSTKAVATLANGLQDSNYCTNAQFNGTYLSGSALTSSNTFTITLTNNSGSAINGLAAPSTTNLTRTWTGTGSITVGSVSPTASFNLANGASQTLTYTLSGTPTSTGTLTLDWSYMDMTCQKVRNISTSDANFSLPVTASVASICEGAGCATFNIPGVVDNATKKIMVNVPYTSGVGSYLAYTSGWIANATGTGEGGDSNQFRISYPAGTFSASGTLFVTVEVDGDGIFNVVKSPTGTNTLIANLPFQLNGNDRGNVSLKLQNCGAPTSSGGFLVFKCHNLGADETADPFTPSWKLNGAYIQWGKKGPFDWKTAVSAGASGFAAAPTGPSAGEANSSAISGWSTTAAADGSWNVTESSPAKTANDPCPPGYRVPTRNEWLSIYNTAPINTQTNWSNVGTWTNSTTNYSSGKLVKSGLNTSLYLPAEGERGFSGSSDYRGSLGKYWSSTTENASRSYSVYFDESIFRPASYYPRTFGIPVRCVKE